MALYRDSTINNELEVQLKLSYEVCTVISGKLSGIRSIFKDSTSWQVLRGSNSYLDVFFHTNYLLCVRSVTLQGVHSSDTAVYA
jgi:hypothetical protein